MKESNVAEIEEFISSPIPFQRETTWRILVVDDDAILLQYCTMMLVRSGYKVANAVDGGAAWKALNTGHYDLLITDNNMPNVTGVELLKKMHRARMAMPVIMSTAEWPEADFENHPEIEPAGSLLKPFTVAQLLETVKRVLPIRAASQYSCNPE